MIAQTAISAATAAVYAVAVRQKSPPAKATPLVETKRVTATQTMVSILNTIEVRHPEMPSRVD